MSWKPFAVGAAALVVLAAGSGQPIVRAAQASECNASDGIDGSSADSAKKKMEAAGFNQIQNLRKGCDNFWHGSAAKNGAAVNIVLSPQGQVTIEGD